MASKGRRKPAPATSPEARENQMISHAFDLAEKQMLEGTASSSVIVHYLKLATTRETLEREKLQRENELLQARVESLKQGEDIKHLYEDAIRHMRAYSGQEELLDDEEEIF